jgi:hypothetical protein
VPSEYEQNISKFKHGIIASYLSLIKHHAPILGGSGGTVFFINNGERKVTYFMSSGTFGITALMAHSKYDTAFNNVSIAILLLSGYSSSHVKND